MSAFVARELKLSDENVLVIEHAQALHDIGKSRRRQHSPQGGGA